MIQFFLTTTIHASVDPTAFAPPLFGDATNGINNTLVIAFSSPVF